MHLLEFCGKFLISGSLKKEPEILFMLGQFHTVCYKAVVVQKGFNDSSMQTNYIYIMIMIFHYPLVCVACITLRLLENVETSHNAEISKSS